MPGKDDIKEAVREAFDEKMKDFYVEREKHYQHHEFIDSLIKWSDRISNTVLQTVVKAIVTALLVLLLIGFAVWGYKQ